MANLLRNRWFWGIVIILVVGGVLTSFGFRSSTLHISVAAEPVACLGGERASLYACASGFPVTNSLLMTIVVDILLIAIVLVGARNLQIVPRGLQNVLEVVIEGLYNFGQSIDRKNIAKFFPFCASVFIFFVISNLLGLFPGVGSIGVCAASGYEEARVAVVSGAPAAAETGPTSIYDNFPLACPEGTTLVPALRATSADLNVTVPWALVSLVLIQYFGFQSLGPGYLNKFFNFKQGPIMAFVGLIELVSEIIRFPAFALRLFGNIFAGEVLLVVMSYLFSYLLPAPFYAFETFVALMQAIIFAVLSLIFMSQATEHHGDEEHAH